MRSEAVIPVLHIVIVGFDSSNLTLASFSVSFSCGRRRPSDPISSLLGTLWVPGIWEPGTSENQQHRFDID